MGTITALEPQTKRANRVNVYVDGQFALGVSAILAARLRVGQTLSDDDLANLARDEALETAREAALRFLAPRPRSIAEVRQHLAKKKFAAEVIDQVLARLREVGLLDDAAFARYWVENREQFRPRAPRALRVELRRKGLDANNITSALEDVDERESAYRAAQARAYRWRDLERREFLEKMLAFLQRRGFDYSVAKDAAKRAWETRHSQTDTHGVAE
jgi:regulatory protein